MHWLAICVLSIAACGSAAAPHAPPPPASAPAAGTPPDAHANEALDLMPLPDCVRSPAPPPCAGAACVARGRAAMKSAEDCSWATVCEANEGCQRGFVAFHAACTARDARGCYELAQLGPEPPPSASSGVIVSSPGDEADQRRRTHLLTFACDQGLGAACFQLGEDHHGTPEATTWYGTAVARYQHACTAGSGEDCSGLAYAYITGRGVAADPAMAATLLDKACKLGDGYGCDLLGQLLHDGRGVPQDGARARMLFQRACELEPPFYGCFALGKSYLDDSHDAAATHNAIRWFRAGCPDETGAHDEDCQACTARHDLCSRGIREACGPGADHCR